MLTIFDIKDRDPKRETDSLLQLKMSDEILSEKTEVEQLQAEEE